MQLQDYFQSYHTYFWQWEENETVISVPGSGTIAYSEFIFEALEMLTPQGLPPFGSLLLAIIATNPTGKNAIDEIDALILESLKATESDTLRGAISFLYTLNSLPEHYKTGKKRLMVFQAIFADCHNGLSVKHSKGIVKDFRSKEKLKATAIKRGFAQSVFYRDFRVADLLNTKFATASDIISKIASLPDFPKEDILLEDMQGNDKKPEDLIDLLVDNAKTFYVGSLVKRIWSGLNIPVHSTLPSQQPLGGFSDLSNKGDFDKLLLSEFANDDLLFLSRLANNEALFIQREIPPSTNKLERIILMDVSLKNWGTPKTVAFATLLAIAKHPKTTIACKAYAIGNSYDPVYIDSIDTVIDGLQLLEGSLHPAKGLTEFFKEYPSPANREVFIITEASTLKQNEMLKAMYDFQPLINYVIYTDNEGNIDVYKKQQNSKKHLQHIKLPLESLWQKSAAPRKVPERKNSTTTDFPILSKPSLNTKKILSASDGNIFQVTGDKLLLRFYDRTYKYNEKGWEILHANLPVISGDFEIGLLKNGDYMLLMFNPQNRVITLLNINTASVQSFPFNQWKSVNDGFIFMANAFYYKHHEGYLRITPEGVVEDIKLGSYENSEFKKRKGELAELAKKPFWSGVVLKNINTVYINDKNNLVLNVHELTINTGFHIKLGGSFNYVKREEATRTEKNEFTFPDGSVIEVLRHGMIVLKSSNADVPYIYIPTLIDASLGVATQNAFAGNAYFAKEPQYNITLVSAGEKRLDIIKRVKDISELDLREVNDMVSSAPGTIFKNMAEKKAWEIKKELEEAGAVVELHKLPSDINSQITLSATSFFEYYVQPFIKNILLHGTKH
ncbi:MAG: ribosomal protein L7/L12 [Bacteroidota bacterium]